MDIPEHQRMVLFYPVNNLVLEIFLYNKQFICHGNCYKHVDMRKKALEG